MAAAMASVVMRNSPRGVSVISLTRNVAAAASDRLGNLSRYRLRHSGRIRMMSPSSRG